MSINNIKNKLKNAVQDKAWLERANFREENKSWLDLSFAIAVKVLSALRANRTSKKYPKNQKELAEAMGCTPQYVSKLLKGSENLQLETITKIESILDITLIEVPEKKKTIKVVVDTFKVFPQTNKQSNFIPLIPPLKSYIAPLKSYKGMYKDEYIESKDLDKVA